MKKILPPSEVLPEPVYTIPHPTASQLVRDFLEDNHIVIKLEVSDNPNVWDNNGVLLSDKPLLKVTYIYQDKE